MLDSELVREMVGLHVSTETAIKIVVMRSVLIDLSTCLDGDDLMDFASGKVAAYKTCLRWLEDCLSSIEGLKLSNAGNVASEETK